MHKSHNKWTDQSRVGIFLQHPPGHSSSVPLVLNNSSGNVSPQFHCLYDDSFDTCQRDFKFNSIWQNKAKLCRDKVSSVTPLSPTLVYFNVLPQHNISPPSETNNLSSEFNHPWDFPSDSNLLETAVKVSDQIPQDIPPLPSPPSPPQVTVEASPITITRFGRTSCLPNRFSEGAHSSLKAFTSTFCLSVQNCDQHLLQPSTVAYSEHHPFTLLSSYIFSCIATDSDTMTLKEALYQPDRDQFLDAMKKELNISSHT